MTGERGCLSVLHLTDPHILPEPRQTLLGIDTTYYLEAVIEAAANSGQQFDLCLITGDLAQQPQPKSYERLLTCLQALNIPCMCLPGNHDDFSIMQYVLSDEKVSCQKEMLLGNWHIIGLNSQLVGSAAGYLPSDELAFLENILKNESNRNILIAVHHHCVPTGSLWMDTMIIKNAPDLLELTRRYHNVKAIINGHIHQQMDVLQNGIRILTTPSTCFQFKPGSEAFALDELTSGYRWLKLYPNGAIDTEVVYIAEPLKCLEAGNKGY